VSVRTHRSAGAQAEADFLRRYDANLYDRFAVAVDVVLISTHDRELRTLLVRRDDFPFKGRYALPGGFVAAKESVSDAAVRICSAKAGIGDVFLEQLFTFGEVDRDPRMRVVSVVYYALLEDRHFSDLADRGPATIVTVQVPLLEQAGGAVALLTQERKTVQVAFDHARILGLTVRRLRGKIAYVPISLALVGEAFTLLALQRAHEAILGRPLNKDAFRRKMLATGWLHATGTLQTGVIHRPAELYKATPEARRMLSARP
jgi:8-oxo-dGTP diphosphatase